MNDAVLVYLLQLKLGVDELILSFWGPALLLPISVDLCISLRLKHL